MEEVMKILKSKCEFEIWYKLYADDLVLIVNHSHVKEVIVKLNEVSQEFQLIINPKKSGIFLVKNHDRVHGDKVEDIPIVSQYRYLGILIDNSGDMTP
jgi:hypothetical protein